MTLGFIPWICLIQVVTRSEVVTYLAKDAQLSTMDIRQSNRAITWRSNQQYSFKSLNNLNTRNGVEMWLKLLVQS